MQYLYIVLSISPLFIHSTSDLELGPSAVFLGLILAFLDGTILFELHFELIFIKFIEMFVSFDSCVCFYLAYLKFIA